VYRSGCRYNFIPHKPFLHRFRTFPQLHLPPTNADTALRPLGRLWPAARHHFRRFRLHHPVEFPRCGNILTRRIICQFCWAWHDFLPEQTTALGEDERQMIYHLARRTWLTGDTVGIKKMNGKYYATDIVDLGHENNVVGSILTRRSRTGVQWKTCSHAAGGMALRRLQLLKFQACGFILFKKSFISLDARLLVFFSR
jgi:hypothetical protein